MFNTRTLLAKIIAVQIVFIPVVSFADEDPELNIKLGRASVLLERASDGLSKLLEPGKADISDKWADELQNKASDFCAFIQEQLEKAHLDDKEVPLCSVE